MKRKIVDFHTDFEKHWVADLECGHAQHVRHDPPWTLREWVISEEGRKSRMGSTLNCIRCYELGFQIAERLRRESVAVLKDAYEQAGISGLCGEGRWEAAVGALETIDLTKLVKDALNKRDPQDV